MHFRLENWNFSLALKIINHFSLLFAPAIIITNIHSSECEKSALEDEVKKLYAQETAATEKSKVRVKRNKQEGERERSENLFITFNNSTLLAEKVAIATLQVITAVDRYCRS